MQNAFGALWISLKKTWQPSSAGPIDSGCAVNQVSGMNMSNTLSSWLKSIACFAVAFALVLAPPSATHAASGMHGSTHGASVDVKISDVNPHVAHSDMTQQHGDTVASDTDTDEQVAGKCCNGICTSVVLTDNSVDGFMPALSGKYLMTTAQSRSVIASGFLRPPQFLI